MNVIVEPASVAVPLPPATLVTLTTDSAPPPGAQSLATNEDAAVLGENGPIPGLYAAGEITGHFHHSAPNAVAVLRALVFGRIAGIAAAAQANTNQVKARQAR